MILQANLSLSLLTSSENTDRVTVLTKSLVAKEKRSWVNTVCGCSLLSPGLLQPCGVIWLKLGWGTRGELVPVMLGQRSESELYKVFIWFHLGTRSEAAFGKIITEAWFGCFLVATPNLRRMSIGQCSAPAYMQSITLLQSHTGTEIIATIINKPFYNSMLIIYIVQRRAFLLNSHPDLE